ncbi:PIH1 domain-containing protein 1 [Chytridiales sp. JEL 0842]|nr:PIH1 domain-containing protein 1 [Chytridiales sp. JEL 0842]
MSTNLNKDKGKQPLFGGSLEPTDIPDFGPEPEWMKNIPAGLPDDEAMQAVLQEVARNPEAAASFLQTIAISKALSENLPSSNPDAPMASTTSSNPTSANSQSPFNFASGIGGFPAAQPSKTAAAGPPAMMQITPTPGFVIKTSLGSAKEDWPEGLKVFINVCHSSDVPPPPTGDYEEVRRAVSEGDNVRFKVPMSLAGPRVDKDKAGKLCLVFESCINTDPLKRTEIDADFKLFLVQLVFEWIEAKHEISLVKEFSLPKLRSKGLLSTHTIRRSNKPIIAEVLKEGTSETSTSTKKTSNNIEKDKEALLLLPYHQIFCEPPEGDAEFIAVRISLPKLPSIKDTLTLDVQHDKLILTPISNKGNPYKKLEIDLPVDVDIDECGAQFDRGQRVLTVTLTCLPVNEAA